MEVVKLGVDGPERGVRLDELGILVGEIGHLSGLHGARFAPFRPPRPCADERQRTSRKHGARPGNTQTSKWLREHRGGGG